MCPWQSWAMAWVLFALSQQRQTKKIKLYIQLLRLCFIVIKVILYTYVNIVVISLSSVQLSSVTQSCPNLCNPIDCSMPGFPVHHTYYSIKVPYLHLLCVPNEQIIHLMSHIWDDKLKLKVEKIWNKILSNEGEKATLKLHSQKREYHYFGH